jgi:hypothetical protein
LVIDSRIQSTRDIIFVIKQETLPKTNHKAATCWQNEEIPKQIAEMKETKRKK